MRPAILPGGQLQSVRHLEAPITKSRSGDWSGRYRPCDPNPRAHHFLVDGPASAGVAAPPLLSSAPIIAAALSRPVPWPPVDTTVSGTSRPISETISGLS